MKKSILLAVLALQFISATVEAQCTPLSAITNVTITWVHVPERPCNCYVIGYRFTAVGNPNTSGTLYDWYVENLTQGTPRSFFRTTHGNLLFFPGDESCDVVEITVEAYNACTSPPVTYSFLSNLCPSFYESCGYGKALMGSPDSSIKNITTADHSTKVSTGKTIKTK